MANIYGIGDARHGNTGVATTYGGPQASSERPYLTSDYPPVHNESNVSFYNSHTDVNSQNTHKNNDITVDILTSRTPSPTPSEKAMLERKGFIDWKKMMNWKFWFRREWFWYYVIFGIILIITILVSVYDRQIVHALQPLANKIKKLPGGWLIPVAIFFIISFPPLFGHEILAILCGVVWGLWIGFAITALGTFLGEMGNFYAFKYCCRSRGEKLEKKDIQYACLARVVREGGFRIALIARYSAIPGHFTTAVFSTCGMNVLVFALAAALSLPKQFVTVYIGVILEESGTGTESTRDKIISYSVIAVTTVITIVAMKYLYRKMDEVKGDVIYQRRKARQAKLERVHSIRGSSVFNPAESDSDLPLNPGEDFAYQQWDSHGRASGIAGDPNVNHGLHAPAPRRPSSTSVNRVPTFRTEGGGGYATSGERYGSPGGGLGPSATTTSQTVSPIHSPAPPRQESTDSVGWDAAGHGLGGEAYKLPTIQPHTPLSGGFANVPLSANNPFNRIPLQQQQTTTGSPLPPPLAPPPGSVPRPTNPYSPPTSPARQATYPTTPLSPILPQPSGPVASSTYGVPNTASPVLQQYPANTFTPPQSNPHSPIHGPMQYGVPFQPQSPVHVPQQGMFSHPQSPVSAPGQAAHAYGSPSGTPHPVPFTSNAPAAGSHVQEPSDASVYYTPAHSRVQTEQQQFEGRLPTPTHPPPQYQP